MWNGPWEATSFSKPRERWANQDIEKIIYAWIEENQSRK